MCVFVCVCVCECVALFEYSSHRNNNNNYYYYYYYFILFLLTAARFLHRGIGSFTCTQNMKLVTTEFNSGGLHEKHVVATWNLGNHLSICL